jgi:hypothetical protein
VSRSESGTSAILGSRGQLAALADAIVSGDHVLELPPIPEGYEATSANAIHVIIDWEPGMSVARDGDELHLVGSHDALRRLAANVRRFAETPNGENHIHIEWFPDHAYLRPGSEPTVIELTGDR